jgi:class 3 adenylate cyclase
LTLRKSDLLFGPGAGETMAAVTTFADPLEAGREAAARYAWNEALDLLTEADAASPLGPDDLVRLAEAAWWMGRMRDCITSRERAQKAYLDAGNRPAAARAALDLFDHHGDLQEFPLAGVWLQRAAKLLEGEPDCVEHGYLKMMHGFMARNEGNWERMNECAGEALDYGTRYGDKNLMAFGLAMQGMAAVLRGDVEHGMSLLDEATIAAVSGELGPYATGWIYCIMISACAALADWQRAGQWTEAAKRWCDRQAISGFPGVCRVHRAEIMRLRGSLVDAEEEARVATIELGQFNLNIAGWAFYELGEVRLRIGDLDAAEEAFRQAHELGRNPQPGLALVQLKRGKTKPASSAIRRALSDESLTPLDRAKLLPAQVDIALMCGDMDEARVAVEELGAIARSYSAPAMQAAAEAARAELARAEGKLDEAVASAKRAAKLWKQADIAYEASRMGVFLAECYAAEGDREGAELELRSAISVFEKLGAGPDAVSASDKVRALATAAAPEERRVAKTFMFTDIVKSTNLLEAIGDDAWMDLIRWHDGALRALFISHAGEEVDHTGDGFFVAFETADDAIGCAIAIQRALVDHRKAHGFAPQVRIGLHAAEVTGVEKNYRGKGVHEAARIGALAAGGEILASAVTTEALASPVKISEPRAADLKGVAEPVQVVGVLWRDT